MENGYPKHTRYQQGSKNYLWIYLHPKKLNYTSYFENGSARQRLDAQDVGMEKFYFLAPDQLQDNVTHEGQPLENLVSKVANMISGARENMTFGTVIHKVETPLVYSGSDRRKIDIMVNLGVYIDPYRDVMRPVELLRRYSAPGFTGGSITESRIEVPAVFKVSTKTGDGKTVPLINMKYAVLAAVQPTFYAPYIDGYPSRCELTLSFQDMQPLSKDSFEKVTTYQTVPPNNT